MALRRIHLIAPAGSCRPLLPKLGLQTPSELIAFVQETVGSDYHVTGDEALIGAEEDELRGGRNDDRARAEDLQEALADSQVAAVVGLRGGAWFTRILPLIDFSVLDRREKRVAVFGFSELTTLVNIVGAHDGGVGLYAMCPGLLAYGLQRYAELHAGEDSSIGPSPREWMLAQFPGRFGEFFRRCVGLIEGRGEPVTISGRCVRGPLRGETTVQGGRAPDSFEAAFVGGNLTLLSTLIGSTYEWCIRPKGRWLVLEDYNDKPERFDRYLAHLTLARYWDECAGVLLGDFHQKDRDLTPAVLEMLAYHIRQDAPLPILVTPDVGHVWPMSPLPLHIPGTVTLLEDDRFTITWAASALRTV